MASLIKTGAHVNPVPISKTDGLQSAIVNKVFKLAGVITPKKQKKSYNRHVYPQTSPEFKDDPHYAYYYGIQYNLIHKFARARIQYPGTL